MLAAIEVISNRNNPHIDPHLEIWEWQIPAYLFVGGLVAGLMVLMAALELRRKRPATTTHAQWMPVVAIGLISLGMVFLFLDLANKAHVFRFYTAFRPSSPMSWGSWILLLVYPALILLTLGGFDTQRREWLQNLKLVTKLRLGRLLTWLFRLSDTHRQKVLWTTLMVGIGLGVYTGLLLGTMVARPVWNSALMGPLFLTSGISTGAALMLFTRQVETAARDRVAPQPGPPGLRRMAQRTRRRPEWARAIRSRRMRFHPPRGAGNALRRQDKDDQHTLVRWDIAAIAVELVLLMMILIGFTTGSAASRAVADGFLGGPYTAVFWSLIVIAGLLVPLTLNVLEVKRRLPMTLFAPAFVLIGGLALRALFVSAGQMSGIAG